MALFDEGRPLAPAPAPRPLSRGRRVGLGALSVALVALFAMSVLPSGYVIQQPGPVYDTLGSATSTDGEEVPLITVDGADTYPTAGTLDLLTVQVVGNRQGTPSWLDLASAWFDPTRAVVPIDRIFPAGVSDAERDEQNTAMMVDSQQEATAAALTELGYDVEPRLAVYDVQDGSAADGLLRAGDIVVSADGRTATSTAELSQIVNAADGAPVTVSIVRSGKPLDVEITPQRVDEGGESLWRIGVRLTADFTFPIDVDLQLDNVGGPSAGMMFALGIIDVLTPGELNAGDAVAGTGTIDAAGVVGPIGGIRQKLWGARDAGATVFLAPADNCGEVVGHIPPGLSVYRVATLDDSLAVMAALRGEGDLDALPTCTADAGS